MRLLQRLGNISTHRTPRIVDIDDYEVVFQRVHIACTPSAVGVVEVVCLVPDAILRYDTQVVFGSHLLVLVVVWRCELRLQNGNIEFVTTQWRVGVVQNLFGEHNEVVEHLFRYRSTLHQLAYRLLFGGQNEVREICGVGSQHLHGIGLCGVECIGKVELIPKVVAHIGNLLLLGRLHRGLHIAKMVTLLGSRFFRLWGATKSKKSYNYRKNSVSHTQDYNKKSTTTVAPSTLVFFQILR